MPIVIDPNRLHEVKIQDVTFRIKAMTGREMLALSGDLASMEQNPDTIYTILHQCLKGWSGVVTSEGEEVPCTDENIDSLPVDITALLFEKITQLSGAAAHEGN